MTCASLVSELPIQNLNLLLMAVIKNCFLWISVHACFSKDFFQLKREKERKKTREEKELIKKEEKKRGKTKK